MRNRELLRKLEEILNQLAIKIRWISGESTGGVCQLNSEQVLFINHTLTTEQRVKLLCQELSRFDLSEFFLLPAVRGNIEKLRQYTEYRL